MRILITGASGFIGRRLCARLLSDGMQVRAVSRGVHANTDPRIEWHQMSAISESNAWSAALDGVDTVVHLAALAHQIGRAGTGRWEEFFHANVTVTAALAQACATAGVRRFIFMSSIGVCGAASETAVGAHTPPNPVNDYARSKFRAEQAMEAALEGSRTDWCIIRPPLVYGPGNPGNMERLLRLLRSGLPLPFGSIRNRRSFIFVDNLVDAVVTVLRDSAPIRATFVLSDGTNMSTPELVNALATASNMRARVFSTPVWVLHLLGKLGDAAGSLTRRTLPFDSYSVDRLTESLPVDGSAFAARFNWREPVATAAALAATCRGISNGGNR